MFIPQCCLQGRRLWVQTIPTGFAILQPMSACENVLVARRPRRVQCGVQGGNHRAADVANAGSSVAPCADGGEPSKCSPLPSSHGCLHAVLPWCLAAKDHMRAMSEVQPANRSFTLCAGCGSPLAGSSVLMSGFPLMALPIVLVAGSTRGSSATMTPTLTLMLKPTLPLTP